MGQELTHPAKFSEPILEAVERTLDSVCPAGLFSPLVLDPFAGTGRIHRLRLKGYRTLGVELEHEWAALHEGTLVGDSRHLRAVLDAAGYGYPDVVVTSPCYGNRMADTYAGESVCPKCKGTGVGIPGGTLVGGGLIVHPLGAQAPACERCTGTGAVEPSKRYTYRLALGRELTEGSAAGLQWGDEYRDFHSEVWAGLRGVITAGGWLLLNVSDHYRKDWPQPVTTWHAATLGRLGFDLVRWEPIRTRRQGHGSDDSRSKRADVEWLLTFRWPG